jgi:transcriptional regulator with XRE-family HTH domain
MSTLVTTILSEPRGAHKIPLGALAYFRARLKQRIYNLVIREFKKSGLSQADLVRRLGKEPAQLSRLFAGPGNLTLETVSDLLFATNAAELDVSIAYPFSARSRAVTIDQADLTKLVTESERLPIPPIRNVKSNNPAIEAKVADFLLAA